MVMDKKILNEFIDKICDMTGMECYEEELDNHVGKIELRFWGSSEVGVQVSSHLDKFSIYVPFSFEDYGKDEIESDNFDVEDLEIEKRTALHKNLFYLWCQNRELIYPITEWDDGAYMCPGYVAWVGYCNIPYCDDAVLNFVKLVNEYEEVYGQYANQKLREEIVSLLCKNKGIYVTIGRNIILGKEAKISFSEKRINCKNNVIDIYRGKEYVILKTEDEKYALRSCLVDLFYETIEMCEMYNDVGMCCDGSIVTMFSDHIAFSMPVMKDVGVFAKQEEAYLLMNLKRILPFSTLDYQEGFYKYWLSLAKDGYTESNGIIFTEGLTDSIHLQKHWEYIKSDYPQSNISFWDYGMNGEKNYKQEMGGSELLKMCREYAKIKQDKKMIFIADCDDYRVAKEMGNNRDKKYKSWGNNVYSFTLPVPLHRKGNDNICIEHLYTDEEIKQEYICKDGIRRRLYIGKEFDDYGRSIENRLLCTKTSFCGENSNKIIDGTSDARVICSDNLDATNYALSKIEFAKKTIVNTSKESFAAFKAVFCIINEIINDN